MPKYRQLHTKILDSYDFAEISDDFTRVMWLLLIVVVDSEGRAIDNPAWLRAKMFPLRTDVELSQITASLDQLCERQMIVRYSVSGKNYFYIPTFKNHQSGTEKESRSVLPAPLPPSPAPTPEEVQSYSGETPEPVRSNTMQFNAEANSEAEAEAAQKTSSVPAPTYPTTGHAVAERVYRGITGQFTMPSTKREDAVNVVLRHVQVQGSEDAAVLNLKPYYAAWIDRNYSRTNMGWLTDWAAAGEIPKQSRNGKPAEPARPAWVTDEMLPSLENIRLNPTHTEFINEAKQRLREMGVTDDKISAYCAS